MVILFYEQIKKQSIPLSRIIIHNRSCPVIKETFKIILKEFHDRSVPDLIERDQRLISPFCVHR